MRPDSPDFLYVHRSLEPEARLRDFLHGLEFYQDETELFPGVPRAVSRKNSFLKPYVYGTGVIDRRQHVLRISQACPCDCLYCYIKAVYPDTPPYFFYNLSDLYHEIHELTAIEQSPYLNAGENADSFAFDGQSCLSLLLSQIAMDFPQITLELRTKIPSRVNPGFLKQKAPANMLIAVSLNPEEIIGEYESGTDLLDSRISGLKDISRAGYRIAIRLDPMVYSADFEKNYGKLLEKLKGEFSAGCFSNIQLGCLRFTKEQSRLLRATGFGVRGTGQSAIASELLAEEMILSTDGHWRYFVEIRKKMYKFMLDGLKHFDCPKSLSNETAKCQSTL
ncbi:MAG: hypothetical protein PHW04_00825 [Candidatus Wallbacteria bacterium]|nr:hypothetical protein [Candidatus Wallbacteria bacterium]